MSRLEFDGMKHEITLYNAKEEVVGSWEAYNNIDHRVKDMRHLPDKTYTMQDTLFAHKHLKTPNMDTIDGEYGTYGIVRFFTPATKQNKLHTGVGVHSGRLYHNPAGPKYWTMGCIRTNEEAMKAITELMSTDALQTITVKNNMQILIKGHKK